MEKIYAVMWNDTHSSTFLAYGFYGEICGVYDSLEKAQKAIKENKYTNNSSSDVFWIVELPLNQDSVTGKILHDKEKEE